ncbi:MAG: PfkB family carbohydrate kinase [Candidatus Lutacidiplasmatales archaeon]|nr:PfkB family carbohydrate kinase [Thermoplasmata archaeon]
MTGAVADRPRDLLVSGHVNIDRFLSVHSFPAADRTVPVLAHRAELGGTATNIARVASKLGVATGLIARVGDGFPDEFLTNFRRAGIDIRGIDRIRGTPTPTCYIIEDRDGGQRTIIDQGTMSGAPTAKPPTRWLGEYSWVHLTTADPAFQLRLLAAARAHGVRVAADPAQEIHYRWDAGSFRRLLRGSEILFGNRAEIARALEFVGAHRVEELLEHVPLVVRTDGTQGASAFSRSESVHVLATRPSRVRTVVGAGDAFRGGFYAGWFAGQPLSGCLAAASRSAARWIEGRR